MSDSDFSQKPYIVSFDIGKKIFAFVIEQLNYKSLQKLSNQTIITKKSRYHDNKSSKDIIGTPTNSFNIILESLYMMNKIVLISNNDLTTDAVGKTILEEQIYLNMYEVLSKYSDYWDKCAVILIEKQMSFGTGKQNTMAMKLAQHCYSYFIYRYKGNSPKLLEFQLILKLNYWVHPNILEQLPNILKMEIQRKLKIIVRNGLPDWPWIFLIKEMILNL